MMYRAVCLLLAALWMSAPVSLAAPDKAEVKALVEQLGDESYPDRLEAFHKLKKMGDDVVEILREHRGHANPEVRMHVLKLLKLLARQKNELAWIDPEFEGKEDCKSPAGRKSVTLTFKNITDQPIRIFWIGFDGKRQPWRGLLEAGETAVCERSYFGHIWLITDKDEKPVGMYRIDMEDPVIAIRD